MFVFAYVDDLIVAHEDNQTIAQLSGKLNKYLEVKDIGEVTYYLGIKIRREEDGSFLIIQTIQINIILKQHVMRDAKGC